MKKINLKWFFVFVIAILVATTIGICVKKPVLHKPFQLNIEDYLIKFNTDGSVTTTKTITTEGTAEGK